MDIDKIKKELNDQGDMIGNIKDVNGNICIGLKNGDKIYYIDGNNFYSIDIVELGNAKINIKVPLNNVLSLYKSFIPAISTIIDIYEVIRRQTEFEDFIIDYNKRKKQFVVEINEEDFWIKIRINLDGNIISLRFYNKSNKKKNKLIRKLKEI